MNGLIKLNISKGISIFLFISIFAFSSFALTPQEALNKGKSALASAKSVSADFSMKVNGQNVKGRLLSKGSKFTLISNISSNWFNGKDLYTYIPSKKETTVFNPTATELAEVNPLLYLNTSSNYKVAGTKKKVPGIETLVLIPLKPGGGMKSVTIDLNSKTFLPTKIRIVPNSGSPIEISLSNVKLNVSIPDSYFEYPKSKYPKVNIVDMR